MLFLAPPMGLSGSIHNGSLFTTSSSKSVQFLSIPNMQIEEPRFGCGWCSGYADDSERAGCETRSKQRRGRCSGMASFHMASGIYKAPGVIGSEASTVSLNELLWTALFLCFCVCVRACVCTRVCCCLPRVWCVPLHILIYLSISNMFIYSYMMLRLCFQESFCWLHAKCSDSRSRDCTRMHIPYEC
jgi:hypothetical protein